MPSYLIVLLTFASLAILAGGWLGWQLLRQNGRILLRLDELEKRLNELEFGGADEPESLPIGSEAPAFELANLSGERKSLAQFRGQPVLLIFFNPVCGFCREMMPKVAAFNEGSTGHWPVPPGDLPGGIVSVRQSFKDATLQAGPADVPLGESPNGAGGPSPRRSGFGQAGGSPAPPRILILTTGEAEKNRQFFAEHKLDCPVLLQNDGEVAKVYQANGTPTGYLINADGKIASGLAIGAEALLKLASQPPQELSLTPTLSPSDGEREKAGADGAGRANRFSNRSLARSKIKRDGLKAGMPAPGFRLPRLDGGGDFTLSELRKKRVLLVFSDPHCGPCQVLAPQLEKFHRENSRNSRPPSARPSPPGEGEPTSIQVVMISRGEPKENRAKVNEHRLTFPVLLQHQWEISRRYAMLATPIAYLIDEQGVIAADVAVGVQPILSLLIDANRHAREREPALR